MWTDLQNWYLVTPLKIQRGVAWAACDQHSDVTSRWLPPKTRKNNKTQLNDWTNLGAFETNPYCAWRRGRYTLKITDH